MITRTLAALALAWATLVASTARAGDPPAATGHNLQLAVAGDTHARARYLAFAEQADREGYRQVARLFRAAARSEAVRARRHAEAAGSASPHPPARAEAGGPVEAAGERPEPPAVRTTRENLLWALAHENAERATWYPRFIRQARADGDAAATLSFTLAHAAERELVTQYREALSSLERMREATEPYYVCATCGHVVRRQPPGECPVSFSGADAFERVD